MDQAVMSAMMQEVMEGGLYIGQKAGEAMEKVRKQATKIASPVGGQNSTS